MSKLDIRPIPFWVEMPSIDDAEAIAELVAQGYIDAHLNPELDVTLDYLDEYATYQTSFSGVSHWRDKIRKATDKPEKYLIRVARTTESPVIGMINGIVDTLPAQVRNCYVSEEWRGGGITGVAQALLNETVTLIGEKPIDVHVAAYNRRSLGFFLRNSFRETSSSLADGKIPIIRLIRDETEELAEQYEIKDTMELPDD